MILLISLVAITILVTYIKPLFGIEHPQENFVLLIALPEKFTLERDSFMPLAQGYSFPSNHIASAVAFGFIIGGLSYRYSYKFALAFMISFPIIIGFTKLYLFQHNLMDVIGGYLFGLIVVILIVKGLKANTQTPKNFERVQEVEMEDMEDMEVEDEEGGGEARGDGGETGVKGEVQEVNQAEKEHEEKGSELKKKDQGNLEGDMKTPVDKMDNDNNK